MIGAGSIEIMGAVVADRVEAVWRSEASDRDVMSVLCREARTGVWKLATRLRIYDGNQEKDPHADGDTKQGYVVDLGPFLTGLLEKSRKVAADLGKAIGDDGVEEVMVRGGAEEFMRAMADKAWMHTKMLPKEEIS